MRRALLLSWLASALVACTAAQHAPPSPPSPSSSPAPTNPPTSAAAPRDGDELIGTAAPAWEATDWLNSPPLALSGLRGKVVLARWWTAGCPYCAATAPALRAFHRAYADKGLVVVGLYHHKDPGPLDKTRYEKTAKELGFDFPIAIDPEWKSLTAWWAPKEKKRGWTSVSFLVDKKGIIRHIHPGGQYVKGEPEHRAMESAIEKLLAE